MQSEHLPRVVHVVHALDCGGTERALVALLRQLGEKAASHCIVTLRDAGHLASEVPENVSIHPLSLSGRARTAGALLGRICRRLNADIIHARNTGTWLDAIVAGVLTRTQVILGFHGWDQGADFGNGLKRRIRWALKFGAYFASVSQSGIYQLYEQCGIPFERITHLPNGVNTRLFEQTDESRRLGIRSRFGASLNDIIIGSVGSLRSIKGFHVLLGAIAKCRDSNSNIRMMIAGDGPERAALEALSQELGIADRVSFIGNCSDVPAFLSALDIYVCSSLGEGMSNALLEAMATGLPIVATNAGDNAAMIRDGIDGIIVPPGDADSLAIGLRNLTSNEDLRKRLGRSARIRAAQFDLAKTANAYQSLYQSLVESRIPKGRSQFSPAATSC